MAEVLAPIVQTTGSMTMLHSSTDAFQNSPAPQAHSQPRSSQMSRNQSYNSQSAGTGYRGASSAPIAPYAFSSTPQLRQEGKPSAPPTQYTQQQDTLPPQSGRLGHPSHPSSSSDSTVSTSGSSSRSLSAPVFAPKDDTAIPDATKSDGLLPPVFSSSVPDLSLPLLDNAPVKPSPGRYRRGAPRADSSSSVTTVTAPTPPVAITNMSTTPAASSGTATLPPAPGASPHPSHNRASSVDDTQLPRQSSGDQAKRYRRRSLGSLEPNPPAAGTAPVDPAPSAPASTVSKAPSQENVAPRPSSRPTSRAGSSHERRDSAGSGTSSVSQRPSSSRQDSGRTATPIRSSSPSRGRVEATKRVVAPSPLSKPILPSDQETPKKATAHPAAPSRAVQQLSALNERESSKGMKSRLRRAFSFGSAAELRKASAENTARNKLHKEQYQDEHDAEQAAIIAKQEAAGIGAGIYNGQGGFTGSTDNISISSTASSASIMLRKMGHGMRKGTRSIKGLFRPKSVIGVPAADGPVQASAAQVSMVTVEAEREKVNVNASPHDQVRGGTGYPRLERNSLDASRSAMNGEPSTNPVESTSRKSIIGGERERAEVLSSIKRGILKRAGTNSDSGSPVARPDVSHLGDTPRSSAPTTPEDDRSRPVQVYIAGDDYFANPPRIGTGSTRSLPTTTQRSVSFSPRIQSHDAWSSSEYDRRGEIATCNRLTPMLAQQIKEELNSFKMEMEVHELSKPYTHFF